MEPRETFRGSSLKRSQDRVHSKPPEVCGGCQKWLAQEKFKWLEELRESPIGIGLWKVMGQKYHYDQFYKIKWSE